MDDKEALKKIIPAMIKSRTYKISSSTPDYIKQISSEVLKPEEIRNIILDQEGLELYQILDFNFEYDQKSASKLLKVISEGKGNHGIESFNNAISIMQQNGINNDDILKALRNNGFKMIVSSSKEKEINKFKSFGIAGITTDDLRSQILQQKDFVMLSLIKDITPEEMDREYECIKKELQAKKYNPTGELKEYEDIYILMNKYRGSELLFSKLSPQKKEFIKRTIIENLDNIESFCETRTDDKEEIVKKMLNIMSESFGINEEELRDVYIKTINAGADRENVLSVIAGFLPEDKRQGFIEKRRKENVYPNPKNKKNNDTIKIYLDYKKRETRDSIKKKIQADGRCFKIRITTDMKGESKEGKPIYVNNLSKWLFGVPGARGNMSTTRSGECIFLPLNTPQETIDLIEEIVLEKDRSK